MNEGQKQLFLQRVDEVLFYVWDPLGVSDAPEARDEYSSYADHMWRMVLGGCSKADISDYLTEVTTERMEVAQHKEGDDEIAERIWEWKDYFEDPGRLG
jgi:hypothetical protein